jgi:hypothetical protein
MIFFLLSQIKNLKIKKNKVLDQNLIVENKQTENESFEK